MFRVGMKVITDEGEGQVVYVNLQKHSVKVQLEGGRTKTMQWDVVEPVEMNNWVLNEGERLDDLVRGDMKIIQRPDQFCFSLDSILAAHYVSIRKRTGLPIWEPVRELLRSCFLHLAVKILLRLKLIQ